MKLDVRQMSDVREFAKKFDGRRRVKSGRQIVFDSSVNGEVLLGDSERRKITDVLAENQISNLVIRHFQTSLIDIRGMSVKCDVLRINFQGTDSKEHGLFIDLKQGQLFISAKVFKRKDLEEPDANEKNLALQVLERTINFFTIVSNWDDDRAYLLSENFTDVSDVSTSGSYSLDRSFSEITDFDIGRWKRFVESFSSHGGTACRWE